ncbi:MAG: DoxX family membrane protein [Opitutales bacterium]
MIHCLITREVIPGKEAEFETAIRRFFSDTVADKNTNGAQLVTDLDGQQFGILRTFPNADARDAFYASDAFHAWSEEVNAFTKGPAQHKELHGLEAFFQGGGAAKPPPTWKMALITWIGVNLVTTPLLMFLMPVLVGTYGLTFPFENFVFNIFVVAILSWLVMPNLAKFASGWLNAESSNSEKVHSKDLEEPVWRKWVSKFLFVESSEKVRDIALASFALFLGVTTAILHGWPKLVGAYNYFKTGTPWRDIDLVLALGLPFPAIMATIAGLIQFFCSLAVGAGLWARFNALAVSSTLVVALYWNALQGKDNQVALMYFAGFVLLAIVNGGRLSLDNFLKRNKASTQSLQTSPAT